MRTSALRALGLLALALLDSPTAAQDQAATGFGTTLEVAPVPGTSFVSATFENGDILIFDGVQVDRFTAGGLFLDTLETLPGFVFPSFLELSPDESFAIFGESSTGELRRVDTVLGGSLLLNTLAFNFDAAFLDSDHLVVSAAAGGFGARNELWELEISSASLSPLGTVPGPSGPVAVDGSGNLYYATVPLAFPPPPNPTDILRWDAATVQEGVPFDETDATILASGLLGASSMAYDDRQEILFVAENNFGTGASRISRLRAGSSTPEVLVTGRSSYTISNLQFCPGSTPAVFAAFQPAQGAGLRYQTSDFVVDIERYVVESSRPSFLLTGPGTTGQGPFDARLFGGPENGFAFVAYGSRSLFDPAEAALPFGGLPLFLGLALPSMTIVPAPLALNGEGELHQSFLNGGALSGSAAQLILFESDLQFAGTSSAAFLD